MRIVKFAAQVALCLLVVELGLRLLHPLPFRVRGDRIILPVRQSYTFDNSGTRKLDPITRHTTNSIGFRGPEPPSDWAGRLTLLTIGGSTTECVYLSDGKTWTDHLARRLAAIRPDSWVNNAGLDGQSTYGHLILLQNFVFALRPTMALFLVGSNDIERGNPNGYDQALTPGRSGAVHAAATLLADHSEVASTALNLARAMQARRAGFGHSEVDLAAARQVHIDAPEIERVLLDHRERYLPAFARRLATIVDDCRAHNIEPVFITQPALFGETTDPVTGIDLRTVQVNGRGNGLLEWRLLESYNDVTREIGATRQALLIDLARELPKDSRYFYDYLHFTNEGAARVGDIVFEHLQARLQPKAARD